MTGLARAVITACAGYDLCDDDVMDPDFAVKLLETISAELSKCTEAEILALREAVVEMKNEARDDEPYVEFLDGFLVSCGLSEE